jgi:PAS domain S-box-containing protein
MGFFLGIIVLMLWWVNTNNLKQTQAKNVEETAQLVVSQFRKVVQENIRTLENLKSRIEVTDGDYLDYWKFDAGLIVEQNPSFLFVEWIDTAMVIQMVEPFEQNKEAVGLDISTLDYRREEWNQARIDSIINFTHWLELVQGSKSFLVDAPVYFSNQFRGTITAGIDPTQKFDEILHGLDQYYVTLKDKRGKCFYARGDSTAISEFRDYQVVRNISVDGTNMGNWEMVVIPNQLFDEVNDSQSSNLILKLGLLLSILVAVLLYFMITAYRAQKLTGYANKNIRELIESSPMAIYSINTDGVVKDFWNKAAEDMLGWKREEVIGEFMPHVEGEWKEDFFKLMGKTINDGIIQNREIIRSRKDGTPIHLRLNVGRLVGEKGEDQQMLAILEDITPEKKYQQQIEESLEEKMVLLSEVHHRVKNNLAIIVGLIELQKDTLDDDKLVNILNVTQNRIHSISGVHELLYNTESFSEISFEEYAKKLIGRLQGMFQSENKVIEISYDFELGYLNINQAIPLGLLLNEMVTNSFKHAFNNRVGGEISISIKQENDNSDQIKVIYRDNGMGFDNKVFESSNTLGVTLIKTLLSQLNADYTINARDGFQFVFTFQVSERGSHSNI